MMSTVARIASIVLFASSAFVWLLAAGELCDWGRFRPWWRVRQFAELEPGPSGRVRFSIAPPIEKGDRIVTIAGKPFREGMLARLVLLPFWFRAWRRDPDPWRRSARTGVFAAIMWCVAIHLPGMFALFAGPPRIVLIGYGVALLPIVAAVWGWWTWRITATLRSRRLLARVLMIAFGVAWALWVVGGFGISPIPSGSSCALGFNPMWFFAPLIQCGGIMPVRAPEDKA